MWKNSVIYHNVYGLRNDKWLTTENVHQCWWGRNWIWFIFTCKHFAKINNFNTVKFKIISSKFCFCKIFKMLFHSHPTGTLMKVLYINVAKIFILAHIYNVDGDWLDFTLICPWKQEISGFNIFLCEPILHIQSTVLKSRVITAVVHASQRCH